MTEVVVNVGCQDQGVEEGTTTSSRGERGKDEMDIEGKDDEKGGDLTHGGGSSE